MGVEVKNGQVEGKERQAFMKRLLRDISALESMLEDNDIMERGIRRLGAEQELFIVDSAYRPTPRAVEILETMNEPLFEHELGLYNLECSVDPVVFGGDCLSRMEAQLTGLMTKAREACRAHQAQAVMTGILPTIQKGDLGLHNQTPNPRYRLLNDTLSELRGDSYDINIKGADEVIVQHDDVMLESANTSFQIHFQVAPEEFARLYNIAQAVCAPVLAAATNSALLFGRRLWHETRIALFQQAVDTRAKRHHMRQQPSRVSFGSRWMDRSVMEIFHEDIARFRVLFAADIDDCDPFEALARNEAPGLGALRLHNSTVYRWNRPCYGISDNGKAHLRIENRVLPSGPTTLDEMANAAFWFGLMSGVVEEFGDITRHMDFSDAHGNFVAAARHGIQAPISWTDGRSYAAHELIAERLLPLAREGLREGGIDEADITRYLGVIERRVDTRQTGSVWLFKSFNALNQQHTRTETLNALCAATIRLQEDGEPVHTWPIVEDISNSASWKDSHRHVGQYMSQDLITLKRDEPLEFAASLMGWHHVHWIPVEDNDHRLVGLITHDILLNILVKNAAESKGFGDLTVQDVMLCDVAFVSPDTSTRDALEMMTRHDLSCIPVVEDAKLVGLITEKDVMTMAMHVLQQNLDEHTTTAEDHSA